MIKQKEDRQVNEEKKNCGSQIRRFYAGKQILLTGCTGYLGTVILEKILRTCNEIGKIYVMIREKKNMEVKERLEKYFTNNIFDTLRGSNPNFMEKVELIYGDLHESDLGLSPENRRRLLENVNIIIHNASDVHFDAKPSYIFRINVIGTQKLLELATECSRLEIFAYVSTAYSNPSNATVEEKFYPSPADIKLIKDVIKVDEETKSGLSQASMRDIAGSWINFYPFSKATAENLVKNFGIRESLPCIVYRPSIITGTHHEPIVGWIGNKNGPVLAARAVRAGLINVLEFDISGSSMDLIPVDMTANGLLAAIWDYVLNRESSEPRVYNFASSDWNPVMNTMLSESILTNAHKYPSPEMIRYPFLIFIKNAYIFAFLFTLLNVIPSLFVDAYLVFRRKKPVFIKLLKKVVLNYKDGKRFLKPDRFIKTDNMKKILTRMSETDLQEFCFDLSTINWNSYTSQNFDMLRKLLNEPSQPTPATMKKYRYLMISHYVVVSLTVLVLFYFLYSITCNIFSFIE
ncbi:fatty acyl-CoA reductase wat-like [Bombus pascuorum]|uniref:fatty acyl-CoA reductase wat-like n=1 Tax=Bombus pascuorum TaxID=65598 RepID=UPI00212CA45C|nr:fatty acyl-CoA reductase wat-like [Bombus pascuorum]